MVEFADLFESEEEGFVKKAKVGITCQLAQLRASFEQSRSAVVIRGCSGWLAEMAVARGSCYVRPSYSISISLTHLYYILVRRRDRQNVNQRRSDGASMSHFPPQEGVRGLEDVGK